MFPSITFFRLIIECILNRQIGVRSQHVKKCSLFVVDAATYEADCVGGLQLNTTDPEDRMLTPYTAPKPERSLAERNISPRSLDPKGYR